MIPDVMENQIWRAVYRAVVRDENFRRAQIESPSTVFKNGCPEASRKKQMPRLHWWYPQAKNSGFCARSTSRCKIAFAIFPLVRGCPDHK